MSGTAIRSQAPFNVQRKPTHILPGTDSSTVKKTQGKVPIQRSRKDMEKRGTARPTTKPRSEKSRNHAPVVVDTLRVRMPAPSDTRVPVSSLSSSADNISSNDLMEDSSSVSLNTSLGRKMADIMLEMQDEFSSDQGTSGNLDQNGSLLDSQWIQSPSFIATNTSEKNLATYRESPISFDDSETYSNDLTMFIKDSEIHTWSPYKKESDLKISTRNVADPPSATQNANDIEQQQVRQFVEKLKKAVSSHSIRDDNNNSNNNDDVSYHRQRYSKLEDHVTSLRSIWDETNPIPSDLSDSGSDESSLEIPSFPDWQRPTLPNRQSSDADINATWVKDQDNAPIAWLSRNHTGSMYTSAFACPVPAKFILDTKQDHSVQNSNAQRDEDDESHWKKHIPIPEVQSDAIADIPPSTATNVNEKLPAQSSNNDEEAAETTSVDHTPDVDAIFTVPSPSLSNCERSEITDSSSLNDDAYNDTSVDPNSDLVVHENAQQDDRMLVNDRKGGMVDTNLEAAPENILQAQSRPHTHVFHRHTYSFSRDVSIATSPKDDTSISPKQLTQTKSVAVSFNQPYTPIELDPIAHVFHKMISACDPQDYREDRCDQGTHVATRQHNDNALKFQDTDQDASLATIVEHLARLRPFHEWSQIRYLDLSHQNLSIIPGLRECVPSLEVLIISHNAINHIEKLPRRLRQLKAHHNRITSCTGMSDLHDLAHLNVSHNMLESLQELSTLRNLQEMHAENNMISTWDGVRHMKSLARLNLSCNRLRDMDLSESSLPSLEMLNLAFNRIERLENIENLPCLRAINLDHNEIKWINVYQPLRSLELLRLSFNRLRVLDASQFPAVKTLYLDDNQLLTVKHLSSMKALDSFSMRDQGGHKVDICLNELIRVRKLFLSGNPLPDLRGFEQFTNLEYLELCSIQLETLPSDFSFHFPNLVILYLAGNYLSDIGPIAGCSQLQKLVLVDNRLDDVASLRHTLRQLSSLLFLDLRHNTLTSKFYATLSNPTGPSEDLISHYLSYEHDLRWSENDHVFNRCMPSQWRRKREEYRASVLKACKKIKSLDGIKVDKNEYLQARELLRARSKHSSVKFN